jgi:hypothetical protein
VTGSGIDFLAVQEIGDQQAFDDLGGSLGAGWSGHPSAHPDGRGISSDESGDHGGINRMVWRTLHPRVSEHCRHASGLELVVHAHADRPQFRR